MQNAVLLAAACIAMKWQASSAAMLGARGELHVKQGANLTSVVRKEVEHHHEDAMLNAAQIPDLLQSAFPAGDVGVLAGIEQSMHSIVKQQIDQGKTAFDSSMLRKLEAMIHDHMLKDLRDATHDSKTVLDELYSAVQQCHENATSLSGKVEKAIQKHTKCRTKQAALMVEENKGCEHARKSISVKDLQCETETSQNQDVAKTSEMYCNKGEMYSIQYAKLRNEAFSKLATSLQEAASSCSKSKKLAAKAQIDCRRSTRLVDGLTAQCNKYHQTVVDAQCKSLLMNLESRIQYDICYEKTTQAYLAQVSVARPRVRNRRLEYRILNRISCYLGALGQSDQKKMRGIVDRCIQDEVDVSPVTITFHRPPEKITKLPRLLQPCSPRFMEHAYSQLPPIFFFRLRLSSGREKPGLHLPPCLPCDLPATPAPTPLPASHCVRLTTKVSSRSSGMIELTINGRRVFRGRLWRNQKLERCSASEVDAVQIKGLDHKAWIGSIEYSHAKKMWHPLMLGAVLTSEVAVARGTELQETGYPGCFGGRPCALSMLPRVPALCVMLQSLAISSKAQQSAGWIALYFDSRNVFEGKLREGQTTELCSATDVEHVFVQGTQEGAWYGGITFKEGHGSYRPLYNDGKKTDKIYVGVGKVEGSFPNSCGERRQCELARSPPKGDLDEKFPMPLDEDDYYTGAWEDDKF